MAGREQVSFGLECPRCKEQGIISWEEDENPIYGRDPDFKSVSDGFKRSTQFDKKGHFGIACKKCKIEVPY